MIFSCLLFNSSAQENTEQKNKLRFSDKIIHSFGLQYNNAFHSRCIIDAYERKSDRYFFPAKRYLYCKRRWSLQEDCETVASFVRDDAE